MLKKYQRMNSGHEAMAGSCGTIDGLYRCSTSTQDKVLIVHGHECGYHAIYKWDIN